MLAAFLFFPPKALMTGITLAANATAIGNALDSVITYGFATLTNNITVFVLFLCFGIAMGVWRYILRRVGGGKR